MKATADGSVKVWVMDMATGASERELVIPSTKEQSVLALHTAKGAFGPGGQLAVWVGRDVVIWDAVKPEPIHRLTGHDVTPLAVVFSSDGSRLFSLDSGSEDENSPQMSGSGSGGRTLSTGGRTLRAWELVNGRELLTISLPNEVYEQRGSRRSSDPWKSEMWMEGDRLMLRNPYGVRVFDGTPRTR